MTLEKNKALIRRGFEEEWNQGKLDIIAEIFVTDLVCHSGGNPDITSQEGWKQFVITFRDAFPDIHFTIEDQIAEGDMVATRWKFTGTHKGELMGITPTNRQVTVTGTNIYRFVGSKIAEFWINMDGLGMLQQLGAVSPL